MKTKQTPPAAGQAAHIFPKLYRCRDSVSGEHCLCKDDSTGQRVLNVTLSGHLNAEPNQAAWAAFAEHACNTSAANEARIAELVGALCGLLGSMEYDISQIKNKDMKIAATFRNQEVMQVARKVLASIHSPAAALALAKGGAS